MATSDHHSNPKARGLAVLAVLVCLTAAALVAASALARPATTTGMQALGLQTGLDALVAAGAPGVILLVRNGNHTVRLTAGLADVAHKRPMRPDDRFRIASLTKTYTATVVLQLVAEGKLALSDSVERRLPGLVPNGSEITIHQLLNHTSGIFSFEQDPRVLKPYLNGNYGYHWAPRKLVEIAVSHKPLFAPGAGQSYSSTNYVIAGLIVEALTGKPIGAQLRSRIFPPLHLAATTYPTTPRMPSPYARGYYVFGKPPATDVTGISPSLSPASGAIVSNAADVADFYRALLSGRLLEPGLLQAMKTTLHEGIKTDIPGYGLGLQRFRTSCGAAWGHSGDFPGYVVIAYSSARGERQAVLMANTDSLSKRAGALYDKLIGKAYCAAGTRP
jgi:D-alanyl-D-alanine carboxypeptidase